MVAVSNSITDIDLSLSCILIKSNSHNLWVNKISKNENGLITSGHIINGDWYFTRTDTDFIFKNFDTTWARKHTDTICDGGLYPYIIETFPHSIIDDALSIPYFSLWGLDYNEVIYRATLLIK